METPTFSDYVFSADGKIYSIKLGRFLTPYIDRDGYRRTTLTDDDGNKHALHVARLMLMVFKPCDNWQTLEAAHGDGNSLNDALSNLRWDSHKGNHQDRIKHGTATRGEENGFAKLSGMAVRVIRRCLERGIYQRVIGKMFGVNQTQISRIKHRRQWASV